MSTPKREWCIRENAYGGTSLYGGRREIYSDVAKLDANFTADELRLVSAAPDLLEASKAAFVLLADIYANCERGSAVWHKHPLIQNALFQAIKKAEHNPHVKLHHSFP